MNNNSHYILPFGESLVRQNRGEKERSPRYGYGIFT